MDERAISTRRTSENQLDGLTKLLKSAEHHLADLQPFHTRFQIDNFIIGAAAIGPQDSDEAALGAYVQAQREIRSRLSSIYSLKALLCKMNLEVAQQEGILDKWQFFVSARAKKLKRAAALAEIDRLLFEIGQTEASLTDTFRELHRFIHVAAECGPRVRAWSVEKRNDVEVSQWCLRFERSMQSAAMCGSPDSSTVHTINELPERAKQMLLAASKGSSPMLQSLIHDVQGVEDARQHRRNALSGTPQHLSALEDS